jgi:hypothetical protein
MVKDRCCPSFSDIIIISNQSMEKGNDDVFRKKRPGSEKKAQATMPDMPSESGYNHDARAAGAGAGM